MSLGRILRACVAVGLLAGPGLALLRPVAAPSPGTPVAGATIDVRTFGATGDGRTLDTPAINRAIAAAAAAGGGRVRFPAGTYLSVSIHLMSNVGLHLDRGATIVAAAPSVAPYDAPEPNEWGDARRYQDFGHSHWHNALIWGEDLHDVTIDGEGSIDGTALVGAGDKSISLKNCRKVVVRDVTIRHGGWFALLATGVDDLTIDHLTIDTNRDGIDLDSCRGVRIARCTINAPFDDAISLKSSFALGRARATEDVTITRCRVSGYDEGTLIDGTFKRTMSDAGGPAGRIKLGTESFGGFRKIVVSDCVFERSRGLAIASVDGGAIEDVRVSDLTMRENVNAPIFVRLGTRVRGPGDILVGTIRRVDIRRVTADEVAADQGVLISGVPGHPIEDLRLSDVRIVFKGGGDARDAALEPPEIESEYPEPARFGRLPAWGLFARHVRGLALADLDLSHAADEARPAIVLDDVEGAEFDHLRAPAGPDRVTFALRRVRDFRVHDSPGRPDRSLATAEREAF